jgi:HTH-type transcriptional regulator, sugar sensing transcriptional regulator
MDRNILKKLGFSDKSVDIYLALLQLGPSSVRKLAEFCDLNRGTTYDALKILQDTGVVTFYKKESKQHFVAENPEKLHDIICEKQQELSRIDTSLEKVIPELQALHHSGGDRPVAKYYDATQIGQILEDVLFTCEESDEAMYRIYSSEGLREYLYKDFPTFSDVRLAKGISVKVLAIGDGGELRGLDERKWIPVPSKTTDESDTPAQDLYNPVPTYIIIYPGKTAYISLNAKEEPVGVVIENDGVYETQRLVFDQLWLRY